MASRLITAIDTQYSSTLLASLNEQRSYGVFCDVTVIVEDKKFKAHRNILSASSTFFHQLFTKAGMVVELSFVRAEIFAEILNYVYSSKIVDVRTDLLEELIQSGQALGVRFIAELAVPSPQKKSLSGGVKANSANASSGSCQKAPDIKMAIKEQPVLNKDTGFRPAPFYTPAVALPIDEHKELDKPADSKSKCDDSENDDVVFCSEIVPLKRLVSKNKQMKRRFLIPNTIKVSSQQISVNSIYCDLALSTDKAKSPLPSNSDPPVQTNSSCISLSDPGQSQAGNIASCSEPILSEMPVLGNISSCSEPEPSKTSVLDNTDSCSVPVPLNIPVLDHTVSCSEPHIPKASVLENTEIAQQKSISEIVESPTHQMNTDSNISAETPLISSVKSPDDLLCEDVPQSQACGLPDKIDDQRQQQDDGVCSALITQKPKVLDNSELAELSTDLDVVESLSPKTTVNNSVSDPTPVTENVNSPNNVMPPQTNCLVGKTSSPTSDSKQTQNDIVLSPEFGSPKSSISNSTEEAQQPPSLDSVDSASEQKTINSIISAETSLIENTKSPSEVPLKCVQSSHADSLPGNKLIQNQTQGEDSCAEISSPNLGVSGNNEECQEKTVSQVAELSTVQMTTDIHIPAQTILSEMPKRPISLPPKCDQIPLSENTESPIQTTLKSAESPMTTISNISGQAPIIKKRKSSKPPVKCVTSPMTDCNNMSAQSPFIQKTKSPSNTTFNCAPPPMTAHCNISPQAPYIHRMSSPGYMPSRYVPPQMNTNNEYPAQTPFVQKTRSPCSMPSRYGPPYQQNTYYGNTLNYNQMQAGGSAVAPSHNQMNPNTMMVNPYQSNSSCSVNSFPENHLSPINMLVQQLPSINTFVNKRMPHPSWPPNTNMYPSSHNNQTNTERVPAFYGPRLQNPQRATFSQQTTSKSAELKIKIGNVNSGSGKDGSGATGAGSQHIMDGKKIITLDTPSEMEGLSTGCKVYANIGEDTYDIVIPIKREPDEDEGSAGAPNSSDDSSDIKRAKLKHEDHYELNVDGKVYYICIVCKRSYVSRTSLRRHFNVHSWEKKYQCRHCEKVFALAEYRTKHEVVHTGAKRYQCLTCGETFMYHKLMSVHMKAAHSQDPQADHNLYRLHPLKSLQAKQEDDTSTDSTAHPSSSTCVGNETVRNNVDKKEVVSCEVAVPSTPSKPVAWENEFVPPGEKSAPKESQSHDSTEFEFVIPESY